MISASLLENISIETHLGGDDYLLAVSLLFHPLADEFFGGLILAVKL